MNVVTDHLLLLSLEVTPHEMMLISFTCRTLYNKIRYNEILWKMWCAQKHPNSKWSSLQLELDDWIRLTFSRNVETQFHILHLRRCLRLPQSHLESKRLYMSVSTPTLPANPSFILVCDGEFKTNGRLLTFTFKHRTEESFLMWCGEAGHHYQQEYYMVDRQRPGEKIFLDVSYQHGFPKTMLGKRAYARIGTILHNDANYYESERSTSYNYSNSHNIMRMGSRSGFGDNTNTVTCPNLNVKSYQWLEVQILIDEFIEDNENE